MGNKREREELSDILARNIAWIENCDSKTSIMLGGIGVIVGLLLTTDYVSKFAGILKHMLQYASFGSILYLLLGLFSICTILMGIGDFIKVLIAKINPKGYAVRGAKTDSLIHFASIAKHNSFSEYKTALFECNDDTLLEDMASQIYICSIICTEKFRLYRKGLLLSVSGFALFGVLTLVGLLVAK